MEQAMNAEFVVLGGGVAGLTFALAMARRGRQVVVLESEQQVGGLSRTVVWGDYRFDLGGHRFHSLNPQLTGWVRHLMDGDLLDVPRSSHIWLDERYEEYPLKLPNALTAFGLPKAIRVLASYLRKALVRKDGDSDVSFEDWVVRRYGQALYDIYFAPYTRKVWGLDCSELSAEWASDRIKLPSLSVAVRESLFRRETSPATVVSRFLYPQGGIGLIPQRMAEMALATGRTAIHLNSHASALRPKEGEPGWMVQYYQGGERRKIGGDRVISTVPLGMLVGMLPSTNESFTSLDQRLAYRGVICILLAIEGGPLSSDTWTYYPDETLVFGRTHEPANWDPQMVPAHRTSLCLEIFATPGDETWQRSDSDLLDQVVADLGRVMALPPQRVLDGKVVRVPYAYPVYRVGYADELQRVHKYLARWPNLHLLGRTGSFRYLNLDAVIESALCLADTF